MKKTIQPTFNEVEYNSILKLSKEQGFSTPSGLVKFATMQYVNSNVKQQFENEYLCNSTCKNL